MKMLTGLLQATEGKAWLFGQEVDPKDLNTRMRVGYMSQAFSLQRTDGFTEPGTARQAVPCAGKRN